MKKINSIKATKKTISQDLLIGLLIVLIAFASYGLGKLSAKNLVKPSINIVEREMNAVPLSAIEQNGAPLEQENGEESSLVVASKNGSKYHFPWCSGAQSMKEENKVYFNSIVEARESGYLPAGNCSGLE